MMRGDRELIAAIGAGDAEAEAELFRRFDEKVRWLVDRSLPGRPDREDLCIEVFQALLTNLRKGAFRGESKLGTYIHAITKNKIAERLRRRRPEQGEVPESIHDRRSRPDEDLHRKELGEALRASMDLLKPKYRTVLYLYYFKGLSVAEVAERLRVSPRRISEWKDYAHKVIRSNCESTLNQFR